MFTLLTRHHFTAFAHMAVHVLLGTAAPNRLLWHVEAMALVVDEINAGHCRRAIITVPPRHLKSTVATAAHIAWRLGNDPTTKILLVCYSKDLAKELLSKARAIMAHRWYRAAFPGVAETLRINRADFVETACGGTVRATSFAAGFTGMGADLIIVDDPLSAQAAFSETQRERCNRTFDEGLRSRLNDPARGAILVVMQRFHEQDLVGHLLAEGAWHELRLPLVAEEEQVVALGGGRHEQREAGTTLDPERMPASTTEEIRRSVGSVVYGAQYQQDPQPAEGALLRTGNLGTYERRLRKYDEFVIAVDTAVETGELNDYTACVVLGRSGHRIHVLQVERGRLAFVEQIMLVRDLSREYPAAHVLVEAANSGGALVQELQREFAMHVTRVSARRSKEHRAIAVAPLLENGDVFLPVAAEWREVFLREVRTFPHGRHDDMVDALVHGLAFLRRHIRRLQHRREPMEHQQPPPKVRPLRRTRPRGALMR
jgi:predicted phage terminase large subunit-like protein